MKQIGCKVPCESPVRVTTVFALQQIGCSDELHVAGAVPAQIFGWFSHFLWMKEC